MEKKNISYRIMETHDFDNSWFYRIADDCGRPEDDLEIEVELDKHGILWLSLSGNHTIADWWGYSKRICRIWKRIKMTLRILFTGWFEAHGEFIVLEEKHIDSIINFLEEVKKKKETKMKEEDDRGRKPQPGGPSPK